MVIDVVICQAKVSRPTSCNPRVLYRPILMEDLYLQFILFIFKYILLIFYFISMTTFVMMMMMMMMRNPQNIGKPHRSPILLDFFSKWHIVDFKIRPIGYFWKFL